jgi:hypothetical protein
LAFWKRRKASSISAGVQGFGLLFWVFAFERAGGADLTDLAIFAGLRVAFLGVVLAAMETV